ncbi:MAG: hypothetical protein QGG09_03470, partial [Pirellulaceae bacterium]|nr:hypothetical protein [Pirellulaceae bacterium]
VIQEQLTSTRFKFNKPIVLPQPELRTCEQCQQKEQEEATLGQDVSGEANARHDGWPEPLN